METLYLIPARGGSKGIPGKNIKPLGDKLLIEYTIEFASHFNNNLENICVSTDDKSIAEVARNSGLDVPFIRPPELSMDNSSSQEVIIHALNYYKTQKGKIFDAVILLQPTSPFRKESDLLEMQRLFSPKIDMVVSVKVSEENPYYTLFEEDDQGYLIQSKKSDYISRQQCPDVYSMNGSIYIINTKSIFLNSMNDFKKVIKYKMEDVYSIDIDSPLDWAVAETILSNGMLKPPHLY